MSESVGGLLRVAFRDDFRRRDSVLMFGNEMAIASLGTFLKAWSEAPADVPMGSLPFVMLEPGTYVTIKDRDAPGGQRVGSGTYAANRCVWRLSAEDAAMYAESAEQLVAFGAGHVYLDGGADELLFVMSMDEGYQFRNAGE